MLARTGVWLVRLLDVVDVGKRLPQESHAGRLFDVAAGGSSSAMLCATEMGYASAWPLRANAQKVKQGGDVRHRSITRIKCQ